MQLSLVTGAVPAKAPLSGFCFSVTDTTSGYPYAAMSCSAMNGATYAFWWNDMGGTPNASTSDDKAYNDACYSVSCAYGTGNNASKNTQVVLAR